MAVQLQKKSILLMIFLTFITYGIYYPIWFLNRIDALNSLDSKEKINRVHIHIIFLLSILSLIMIIPSVMFAGKEIAPLIDKIIYLVDLVFAAAVLVVSFKARKIISEHYKTKLSGVATFFFANYYLQYKINNFLKIE